MDVLVVIGQLSLGGTESHLLQVLPRLKARGLDCGLFAFRGDGELSPLFRDRNIELFLPNKQPKGVRGLLPTTTRLLSVVIRHRPRIIHFFLPEAYLLGGISTFMLPGFRRIMSRRSLNSYQTKRKYSRGIERFLHRRMTKIFANSTAIVNELYGEGVKADKVSLIRNGIPMPGPQESIALDGELNIQPSDKILVLVGNIIPYKGHEDLLNALAILKRQSMENFKILFIGKDSVGEKPKLMKQVRLLGLEREVIWLGQQQNPAKYLALANIGISASHEEGFSNALIEYMFAGLGVVATKVGGNIDAIIDKETGLLVPASNPQAMADALSRLLNDNQFCKELGKAARTHAQSNFTLERCVSQYFSAYQAILQPQSRLQS